MGLDSPGGHTDCNRTTTLYKHLRTDFACLFCVLKCDIGYDTYMTLSSREKPLFHKKNFLDNTPFYSVRTFARIRQHNFTKYWGDGCMGRPHLKFWGRPSAHSS